MHPRPTAAVLILIIPLVFNEWLVTSVDSMSAPMCTLSPRVLGVRPAHCSGRLRHVRESDQVRSGALLDLIGTGGENDMTERSEADWKFLVTEGHEILKRVARDGNLTNYGEFNTALVEATGLPGFDLTSDLGRAGMGTLLGRIAIQDWAVNPDFMLTALVKRTVENNPGKGFFKLAEQEHFFDPATRDELDFWQEQVGKAHDRYARHSS